MKYSMRCDMSFFYICNTMIYFVGLLIDWKVKKSLVSQIDISSYFSKSIIMFPNFFLENVQFTIMI